jgi:hypothetical protein
VKPDGIVDDSSAVFFTSELDRDKWSVSRFTPRETAPCTHWIRGWVGPRAGLDAVKKNVAPGWNRLWLLRPYPVTIPHGVFLLPGNTRSANIFFYLLFKKVDRLCGLMVRVTDYRSRGPGSIPAPPDFLRSSGSRTGSTQPREYN